MPCPIGPDRSGADLRSITTSCIRLSQLSRPRRGTHPRSCSLHPATHRRAASSASDSLSGTGPAPPTPLTLGAAMILVLNLLLVSWRRRRSLAVGRKQAMVSATSSGGEEVCGVRRA
jgi:hypothetical protein